MNNREQPLRPAIASSEQSLVLSLLEQDQLAAAKKQPIPRRPLKRSEVVILSSLRLYLIFMIAVVIYEVWTGAR